jgi:hypothetical protein
MVHPSLRLRIEGEHVVCRGARLISDCAEAMGPVGTVADCTLGTTPCANGSARKFIGLPDIDAKRAMTVTGRAFRRNDVSM